MSLPAPRLLSLTNDLAEIPRAAAALEEFCEPLAPSMADLMALQLALEETVTNVINHGYREHPAGTRTFDVEFSARATPDAPPTIRLVVTDHAPAYDPLARPEVDLTLPIEERPIGGLGVHLVKKLMTHAAYARAADKNVLTLERALSSSA
jgi:serine/threonine-protein kinase RsbW